MAPLPQETPSMHYHYAFVALELARERMAEAEAQRLAALSRPPRTRSFGIRRGIARLALAVARFADEDRVQAALSPR
jgi:hypothetical protein